MNKEILDQDFVPNGKKRFHVANWVALIILWSGIIYSVVLGFTVELKTMVAIALLIVATIATYVDSRIGIRVTLGIIIIGFINLVSFFPLSYVISFSIGSFGLGFEMILFCIGVIHFLLNRKTLNKFLKSVSNSEMTSEEVQSEQRIKINGFKRRFANKDLQELAGIVKNEDLIPAAIKAAEELIQEKNDNEK